MRMSLVDLFRDFARSLPRSCIWSKFGLDIVANETAEVTMQRFIVWGEFGGQIEGQGIGERGEL